MNQDKLRSSLVTILLACTLGSQLSASDPITSALSSGKRLDRELSADESHEYRVELSDGRFVHLAVEQLGIDVVVSVFDPEGEQVMRVDGSGTEGIEPVTFFNRVAGSFRIEVVPFDTEAEPGRYAIEVLRIEEAAGTPTGRIEQIMRQWDRLDSPGASIAVARGPEILYKDGFGSSQLEYQIPITPTTVFHVASVSKQFTAFAVALLADLGELSLDDDVRNHIPEVPDFGKAITLRHLIHHTSGLRDQWNLLALGGWRLDDVITLDHVMTLVEHQEELNFDPGERHLYCNTGYTLLAEVVARVTGQSFPEWTAENIFEPIGMTNTHFHDDHEMIVPNRAYSYSADSSGFKKAVLSYANVGATSLFTTTEDLVKWSNNLDTSKIGGEHVIRQMHKRGVLNDGEEISYAFGLGLGEHRGLSIVAHSGGDAGFRSYLIRYPDQQLTVTVLSNLGSFSPRGVARQIAEVYLADEMEAAEAQAAATEEEETATPGFVLDLSTLDSYIGEFELEGGLLVSITRDGDGLRAKARGQSVVLAPVSQSVFEIAELEASLMFHHEESGAVNTLTFVQGDQEQPAERIERSEPTPDTLHEYVGDYYSPELGTFYSIVLEEDQLIAQHRRHGKIELTPSTSDEFTSGEWYFGNVRFERDDIGGVAIMRVSSGRVRDVRFERMTN